MQKAKKTKENPYDIHWHDFSRIVIVFAALSLQL